MTSRATLAIFSLAVSLSLGARAEEVKVRHGGEAGKRVALPTQRVHQKDGSVMLRLALPKASKRTAAKARSAPMPERGGFGVDPATERSAAVQAWLDAVAEPRVMTALAAVAMQPGVPVKNLNSQPDPALVRSGEEFSDPRLYLALQAAGLDFMYGRAILRQTPNGMGAPAQGFFPITLMIPEFARAGVPLKSTLWSKAFDEGSGGHEAAQQWLKLPTPDPRANPWLSHNPHYRY